MAKTIVVGKHELGPSINGHDYCYARSIDGLCPGHEVANWLNNLGDDDDLYIKGNPAVAGARPITCGEVRTNYLRSYLHITAEAPERARLVAEKNRLSADLRRVKKQLRNLEAQSRTSTSQEKAQ